MKTVDDFEIKRLCLDIIRDFYSASRKLVMYPIGHPNTNETLKKSIERLNVLFSIKRSFVIQVFAGRLLAEGILLEDNVFVGGLLSDLKKHNINSVLFNSDLALGDLYHFLSRLLEPKSPIDEHFQKYLDYNKVKTIYINPPLPMTAYNFDEAAVTSSGSKFPLVGRLGELMAAKNELIIAHYLGKLSSDEQVAQMLGVDFRLIYVKRHLSEVITSLSENQIIELFRQLILNSNWLGNDPDKSALKGIRQLWEDYSPQAPNYAILLPVYQTLKEVGAPRQILDDIFDKAALFRLLPIIEAEDIISSLQSRQIRNIDFDQLRKTVQRLAQEKHGPTLDKLLRQLLGGLASSELETRQRCLRLAIAAIDALTDGSFWDIFGGFVKDMLRMTMASTGTPEVIELAERVAEKTANCARWQEFKLTIQTLKGLDRKSSNSVVTLASRALNRLATSPILSDIIVDGIISGRASSELFESLAALSSRQIALSLIDRIDAPDKAVRARAIKALISMGKEIGPQIADEISKLIGNGEKEDDASWHRLRNLLRVVGHIKYVEALSYFEIIAGWSQKRVKLELISALEAMQAAAVGPLFSRLATDFDQEVRRAAVVGMGMTGHPDMISYLKNLLGHPQVDQVLLVAALGRLGGPKARDALIDIYENDRYFIKSGLNKKDEEAIRVAIIRALAKIGDAVSKSKVDHYSQQWSAKDKVSKADILSHTARVLLGDIPRNKD